MSIWSDPPSDGQDVTPSDTVSFAVPCRGLYVGTGGDVACVFANGRATVYHNVPTGSHVPGIFKRVNATSTTATDIVALW